MATPAPGFHGFLVIDKPPGLTSRDVVNRAAGWFPRRTRIGHAGTLDPLATGVLPLALGAATRLIEYVQRWDKVYEASILLGGQSDTDDSDGVITPRAVPSPPSRVELEQSLASFLGVIDQVPPAYSAAKVTGRRAYDLARQGKTLDLAPRPVRIDRIDILDYQYPRLDIRVGCGKGTYIRALARDLGDRLGCGGYIDRLRRTQVGCFTAAAALSLEADRPAIHAGLLPLELAVQAMPRFTLAETILAKLRQGAKLKLTDAGVTTAASEVAIFTATDKLALVAHIDVERQLLCPDKVFG